MNTTTPAYAPAMRDGRERVIGTLPMALDQAVPGMLHGSVVRSPLPHGRILATDTEDALREPGVVAVITGADLVDVPNLSPRFGSERDDQPVLAIDRVRYQGEPTALVLAETPSQARNAAAFVDVDYEELPYVVDVDDALGAGAPVIQEGRDDNVCARWWLRHGDTDAGFAQADQIFEDVYTSPSASHVPMEPHVALARWDGGRLVVWTSAQSPYSVRAALARMFGVDPGDVTVRTFNLGGAYGSKTTTKIEPLVACAAMVTGRPVRLELDREGVFFTHAKHAARVRIRTGVRQDGTLVAREMDVRWAGGAYTDTTPGGTRAGLVRATGPYRIPNVAIDSVAAYTNTVPAGPFRGAYTSQLAWAYESQLDDIAAALGIDPVELRRKNLLRPGDTYATGEEIKEPHFVDLLDDVAQALDWGGPVDPAPPGRARGKGIAVMLKSNTTPSRSEARVRAHPDGTFTVLTSTVEMGQGAAATLAHIAAEALDVPVRDVRVALPDTDEAPYDLKTAGSRSTFTMGTAVRRASRALQLELARMAADKLGVDDQRLTHSAGAVHVAGEAGQALSYPDLLAAASLSELTADGAYEAGHGLSSLDPETAQGIAADHWHQAALGVEVEVDLDTGKVVILRCHGAVYAGRVLNPTRVRQQSEGGAIFGLGQALFEELVYDNGQLVNPNFSDYLIPSMRDVPGDLSSSAIEAPDPMSAEPYGVGEMTVPVVAPAVGNAIRAAINERITTLPLTCDRVLRAIHRRVGEMDR